MRVKVSYTMVARDEYEDGASVGIGSVVAPDSMLVGVAGPVATPSAAECLVLFIVTTYDVSTCQCHILPRLLTGNEERTSRYLYNEILAFCENNVLYEVCPGLGPPARESIYCRTDSDSSQVYISQGITFEKARRATNRSLKMTLWRLGIYFCDEEKISTRGRHYNTIRQGAQFYHYLSGGRHFNTTTRSI